MKKILFISLAVLATLTIASCKNNKKANDSQNEKTIETQKAEYGAEAQALIDSLANGIAKYSAAGKNPLDVILSDKEKLVKPDFLFDPKDIDTLVTRSQKTCALAILSVDRLVSITYDMPVEETDNAIAKLAAEINCPFIEEGKPLSGDQLSQGITDRYKACKEAGDTYLFWVFSTQVMNELEYIIAQNPDLYLSKISVEDWEHYNKLWDLYVAAARTLGPIDPEMDQLKELLLRDCVKVEGYTSDVYDNLETALPFYHIAKDKVEIKRNSLLNY